MFGSILDKRSEVHKVIPYLFVYDSLMQGMDRSNFLNNSDNAIFIANATTRGQLFDLGWSPGFVESSNDNKIYGELYELYDFETFFTSLDLIKGFWENQPEQSLYIRKVIAVQANQQEFQAWSYLLNIPTKNLTKIHNGDFRLYLPETT